MIKKIKCGCGDKCNKYLILNTAVDFKLELESGDKFNNQIGIVVNKKIAHILIKELIKYFLKEGEDEMIKNELQKDLKRLQERRSFVIQCLDDWQKTKDSVEEDIKLVYEKIKILKEG